MQKQSLGQKIWKWHPIDEAHASLLATQLKIPLPVAKVLIARGITQFEMAKDFISPKLKDLLNPFLLKDIEKALHRISHAIETKQKIFVYGDYDVDGVTSSSLLIRFFDALKIPIESYVPHRLKEGYGLSKEGIQAIANAKGNLIITVDCGVTNFKEVELANSLGIDVIIIDHHQIQVQLPNAVAILNPHQKDCKFPFKHLAAVGVTFFLTVALRKYLRDFGFFTKHHIAEPELKDYLDLVALGTVADMVPLKGENRKLVYHGLSQMKKTKWPGLISLMEISKITPFYLDSDDLGFKLGPRINAAGRLKDASVGVKLLTTDKHQLGFELASLLDDTNAERQTIEARIVSEAIKKFEQNNDTDNGYGIVLDNEEWHPGVIGIVASRVSKHLNRPTIIIGKNGKGSGRSIGSVDLFEVVYECKETLQNFGGHKAAVGLTIDHSKIDAFKTLFNEMLKNRLSEEDLEASLYIDSTLNVQNIDNDFLDKVLSAGPFGTQHAKPVFCTQNVSLSQIKVIQDKHLSFELADNPQLRGIAFNMASHLRDILDKSVDIAFCPEYNYFNGRRTIQLRVIDIQV